MKYSIFIFTTWFLMAFPLVFRFTGEPEFAEKASYRFIVKPLAWGSLWAFIFFAAQGDKEIVAGSWLLLPKALAIATIGHYVVVFFLKAFNVFGMSFKNGGTADQHRRGHHITGAIEVVRQIKKNKEVYRFSWGGVPIPRRLEDRSFLLVGSPGSGKSQAICAALDEIKKSADRAIITDPSAQFLRRYKREDSLILNPLDARSVKWSPFAEFEDDCYKLDAVTIATSLVPVGHGAQEEWHGFVRSFLRDIMIRLWELGRATNGELNHFATLATMDELRELLSGTPTLANLLGEGSDKLLGSVRTTGDPFLQPLSLLDPDAGKDSFSVRRWTHSGKGWLFVTYQQNRRAVLTPIIGAVLNVFADAMLTRQISKDRAVGERVWGIFDEFPLLGKVSSIENLLTNGSKHGFAGIIGLQTVAQIRATYGHEAAISIMACLRTWLVLRCTDAETAAFMGQHAGKEEVTRTNQSGGHSDGKNSENWAQQVVTQDVLMPAEIQHWPDLQGVLNLAGAYPICPILLQIVEEIADRCVDFEKTAQSQYQQPQPIVPQAAGELTRSPAVEVEL